MGLINLLSSNAARVKFHDLPEDVVQTTKKSILDTLGVMIGASTLGDGCREMAALAGQHGDRGRATILGFGYKVHPLLAALANGAMAHALDYDDAVDEVGIHPTACTLAAALAAAEAKGRVNGKTLIIAIALANDLAVRLRNGLTSKESDMPGWFKTSLFGAFSSALAAAKVLDLDEDGVANALGIALCQASGTEEMIFDVKSSVLRGIRDGFTSKAGLLAALMAQGGIKGVTDPFEGGKGLYNLFFQGKFDPGLVTAQLGTSFRGTDISFKPYPCCRHTHAHINSVVKLVEENRLQPLDIEEVGLEVDAFGEKLCTPVEARRSPPDSATAKFSLPFTLGVALAHGTVSLSHFSPSALKDPLVLEMAKRVSWKVTGGRGSGLGRGVVDLKIKDGRVLHGESDFAPGHPRNPMSFEGLVAKFRDCLSYSARAIPLKAAGEAVSLLGNLERVENIDRVVGLLS